MANNFIVVNDIPLCIRTIAEKYRDVVSAHALNKVAFTTWWYAAMAGVDDWTDWLIEDQVIESLQTRGRFLPGPHVKIFQLEDLLVEVGLHGQHLDDYYDETVRNVRAFIPDTPLPRYTPHGRNSFELTIRGALHENRR